MWSILKMITAPPPLPSPRPGCMSVSTMQERDSASKTKTFFLHFVSSIRMFGLPPRLVFMQRPYHIGEQEKKSVPPFYADKSPGYNKARRDHHNRKSIFSSFCCHIYATGIWLFPRRRKENMKQLSGGSRPIHRRVKEEYITWAGVVQSGRSILCGAENRRNVVMECSFYHMEPASRHDSQLEWEPRKNRKLHCHTRRFSPSPLPALLYTVYIGDDAVILYIKLSLIEINFSRPCVYIHCKICANYVSVWVLATRIILGAKKTHSPTCDMYQI